MHPAPTASPHLALEGQSRLVRPSYPAGRNTLGWGGSGNVGEGLEGAWWKPERAPGQGVGGNVVVGLYGLCGLATLAQLAPCYFVSKSFSVILCRL